MMWKYVNFVIAWVGWKFYNAGNSHLTFEGIILIYRWWATSRTTNHRLLVRVHRDRRCRRWSLFMGGGNLIVFALSGKRLQSHKSHNSQTPGPQDTSDSWRKSTGPLWLKSKGTEVNRHSFFFFTFPLPRVRKRWKWNWIASNPTSLGFSPTLFSNLVGMFWACNQQQWIDHIHLFELSLHTKQSVQYYMYAHINK